MSESPSTICPEGMASQITSDQSWVCAAGMTSSPRPPAPAYVSGKVGILPRITYTGPNLRESWTSTSSFACPSISHRSAVTGGLGAGMGRPNRLITSPAESFVPSASVPVCFGRPLPGPGDDAGPQPAPSRP